MTALYEQRIPVKRPEPMSSITERDLEVEGRLSALETNVSDMKKAVDELKSFVTQARPQLFVISIIGSGVGAIIVAVVVALVTK